jgi:hypothetical protein
MLYQIDLGYACFGISVNEDSRVFDAAPIGKWMNGKHIDEIKEFVIRKHGTIKKI